MNYFHLILALLGALCVDLHAAEKRPFALDDLLAIERVSDPQLSPDGQWVAYSLRQPNAAKSAATTQIWIIPVGGGQPRQLTKHAKGASRPRWSPDGKSVAFLSSRSGSQQIWLVSAKGGEPKQVTKLSTGADNHLWSPTGKFLVFTSDVWPDLKGDDAQRKKHKEIDDSGIQAKVIDSLLYRHWNEWRDGKRTHVFSATATGGGERDLTPGDFDAPPFSLGGPDGFAVSPDGQWLAFTRGPLKPGTNSSRDFEAWSTDANLCLVPMAGGDVTCLTTANKGWDGSPVWSPDGRFIAYRSQAREGYEADLFRLAVVERATGMTRYLAADTDRAVDEILWAPDGRTIYFGAEDEGRAALYAVSFANGNQSGATRRVLGGSHFTGLSLAPDASFLIGTIDSLTRPPEVARVKLSDAVTNPSIRPEPLTHVNDARFAGLLTPTVESVHYTGAGGAQVQAWVMKPPGYVAGKRYPMLYFIHGGPQSAWKDAFSYRWCTALFAAHGYVVMQPNPRGSTSFGQKFSEDISGDWGGACYEDLMKGVDWAIAQGWADPDRMGALGGSFGGYMVNWILGHTDRFKVLVSHAGVFNLESKYGSTEELWFPEWDLGGTPWKHTGSYDKFSPHRFAANFRTPTLVTHGQLDYRVPVEQGMQLFTTLKRQGVESRFLYYPDEGHWILKPKNSRLFYQTVTDWVDRFLQP
jgi:dipeptidyl aminopeptidase/acylaminoacyl peptidase